MGRGLLVTRSGRVKGCPISYRHAFAYLHIHSTEKNVVSVCVLAFSADLFYRVFSYLLQDLFPSGVSARPTQKHVFYAFLTTVAPFA